MTARDIPFLRTSERSTFTECQWRWYQSYVRGLTTVRQPTWSWFGTAVHVALRVRYPDGRKRGSLADVLAAFDEAIGNEVRRVHTQGGELDEEEVVEGRELGRAMLRGYVKKWGKDRHIQVVTGEQPMQIDVPDWRNPRRTLAVYCLTLDLVVWDLDDKCYRVWDHKTRRSFPTDWSFYDHNRQGGSYLWVVPELLRHMGIMKKNDVVDGIVFNCLKKAMPTERILDGMGIARNKPRKEHYVGALAALGVRTGIDAKGKGKPAEKLTIPQLERMATHHGLNVLGDVSAVQPAPLFHRYTSRRRPEERVAQARHVQREAQQMRFIRLGKMEPTKNTTEDCVRCQLYELCQLDETNPQEAEEYSRHLMQYRNPYADHQQEMTDKGGIYLPGGQVG